MKQSFLPPAARPPRQREIEIIACPPGQPGGGHLPASRDIPLGEMLRASRLNDVALEFGREAQGLTWESERMALLQEARFGVLKFHPRFKRYFRS